MPRRKKSSPLEDMIDIVSMLPWWTGAALAPLSYFVLHAWAARVSADMATHPQILSALYFAVSSAGQYILPLVCIAGAAASAWRRHRRKTPADNVSTSRSAAALEGMSWYEFELLVGEGFRRKGFRVEESGGGGADGGIDLVLRKSGEKHLVQCKQWRAFKVGVQVVRELYGVMAAEGAAGGYVVTSGRFTEEARSFAERRNVKLIDGDALFVLLRSARDPELRDPTATPNDQPAPIDDRSTTPASVPSCPKCAGAMVRRTAKKGARAGEGFWGCATYPRCRGTA